MRQAKLLVDGGGSTTRAALVREGVISAEHEGASCNVVSVGPTCARSNLRRVVEAVWSDRGPGIDSLDSAWFCLSTASSAADLEDLAIELAAALPERLRPKEGIWVTNDIAPLLVHDGRIVPRVVAICGTGTGFCALNLPAELCTRVSGHEYLLADEGGGFDLGLQGLRAIMRASDGRGPPTILVDRLAAWRDTTVEGLHALVYSSPTPKILIASFAPFTLLAAEEGDRCALAIVERASTELVTGICAAARGAHLPPGYDVALAGSNLVSRATPILRRMLESALSASVPGVSVSAISASPLQAVLRLSELLPEHPRLLTVLTRSLPLLHLTAPALA